MAIGSINVSRVSTTLQTDTLLAALRQNTLNLYSEQNRLTLGRRFLTASEDPARAARALDLSQILDRQSQIATNIRHAQNTLDATDLAMAEVSPLIIEAQTIASQNVGTLSSPDERAAVAEVVASIRSQLVAVGNRTFEGRYLFAGRDTNVQPFQEVDGGVLFQGDTGDVFAQTDLNELGTINLPGNLLFGSLSSEVAGFVDLDPLLTESTRLEDLGGAQDHGIRGQSFQIVEEGGSAVTVDISAADTAADVVTAINAAAEAAGAGFTAALSGTGITVTPGGAALTIRDIGGGTTAADLGLLTTTPSAAAVVGTDLNARVTRTTAVADLLGGAGIDLSGGLVLTNGTLSATVDLSAAETVQDILNAINNAGVHARARINAAGDGLEVLNNVSGSLLSIGENGGTTATELGLRSFHGGTRLADLNNGLGVRTEAAGDDLRITARDGTSFTVDLDGAETIADVLTLINDAATAAGAAVTADLATVGNGLRLSDTSGGAGPLQVDRENLSYAAEDLGILQSQTDPDADLAGTDVAGVRVNGVLSAMTDLELALLDDDSAGITLAAEELDTYLTDFNRARGVVGAQASAMGDRLTATEDATVATESLLSEVQDLDYTEAVTRFQEAQLALQASLMTGARTMSMTLLNFLS